MFTISPQPVVLAIEPVEPPRTRPRRQRGTIEAVGTNLVIFLFVVVVAATALALVEGRAASPITFAPVPTAPSLPANPAASATSVPAPAAARY